MCQNLKVKQLKDKRQTYETKKEVNKEKLYIKIISI